MRGGDLLLPPGHQALHPHGVRPGLAPEALPRFPDGFALLGKAGIRPEEEISPGGHRRPLFGQSGVLRRVLRLPCVKKGQNGPGHGGIHPIQHRMVPPRRRSKAFPAALGLPFLVHPQEIGGIVPEEVGFHPHRALHRRRERDHLGLQDRFLPSGHLGHQGDDLDQMPLPV